jgi:O-methyltransferase
MVDLPCDYDPDFLPVFEAARHATMTSSSRMYALYKAVRYIVEADIPGDFVECGTWMGGSVMVMALTLRQCGVEDRTIHAYDTFEGMPPPTTADRDVSGVPAASLLAGADAADPASIWCRAGMEAVRANLDCTGYPAGQLRLVKGLVEETIPAQAPDRIALLRLDTDWYASTKHELEQLYPRLSPEGVLIIDDYGHWQGARRAVDEYFGKGRPLLLNRVDYTGRIAVKPLSHGFQRGGV